MNDSSESENQKDEGSKNEINSDNASSNKSNISDEFRDTIENAKNLRALQELLELKSNLKELKKSLIIFNEENRVLNEIYENEDKMINEINQKSNDYQLNDFIFEENAIKIFSDVYELKEYNLYPHFDVGLSEQKRKYATCIFYYRINFQISEEKEPNEKSQSISMYFLDDRETYMAKFEEIPMIFQKEKGIFNSVRVISKTNDFFSEFPFKKSGQEYEAFIPFVEIKDDLIELQKIIIETENIKDSTNDSQEKKKAEDNLKIYKRELKSLKIKYSENTIKNKLQDKKNEIFQLEKNEKLNQKEKEQRKQNLLNEIKEHEKLLKGIIIKINRHCQEFDGFFFTTKEISLKNNIGGILTIPAQKPIIVEAKNISNYKSLLNNIKYKRKLLEVLGLDESKFYYVGILRRIDDDKKQEAIQSIELSNKENTIIIYPDKWDFLGFPLYKLKKEIIEKDEAKNGGETSLQEENTGNKNLGKEPSNDVLLQKILKELEELNQKVKELKVDMDKVKKKMNID